MRRFLLLAAMFCATEAAAADATEELLAVRVLTALDKTCIETQARPEALRKLVAPGQALALPPVEGKAAQDLLAGRSGAAWRLPPQLGEATLAMTDDGVCTVFVDRIDGGVLLGVADGWWKTHPTYRAKLTSEGGETFFSRNFELQPRQGAKAPVLKLSISVSDAATAPYQAALSVRR